MLGLNLPVKLHVVECGLAHDVVGDPHADAAIAVSAGRNVSEDDALVRSAAHHLGPVRDMAGQEANRRDARAVVVQRGQEPAVLA